MTAASLPLGVQFNNPLNVRPDGRSNWQGVIAIEHTPSGPFLHFDAPPKGWRCAAGNVIAHYDKWGHNTIAKLIGGSGTRGQPDYRPGWAPPEDRNDTAGYIVRVCRASGFGADQPLDFHCYAHLKPVLVAMATVEQGASPYSWWSDAQIDWGLAQYGVLPPAKPLPTGRLAAGTITAGTVAAGQVITPSAPPVAPMPTTPGLPTTLPLDQAQSLLQQLAPYFKWAGVALLLLMIGGAAWYWWRQRHKRQQGIA